MAAKVPKNIRFRTDQIRALEAMETDETDFSALVRTAVDEMLRRRAGLTVAENAPRYGRSASSEAARKLERAAKRVTKAGKQAVRKQPRRAA